jgi:hypothetical protein
MPRTNQKKEWRTPKKGRAHLKKSTEKSAVQQSTIHTDVEVPNDIDIVNGRSRDADAALGTTRRC